MMPSKFSIFPERSKQITPSAASSPSGRQGSTVSWRSLVHYRLVFVRLGRPLLVARLLNIRLALVRSALLAQKGPEQSGVHVVNHLSWEQKNLDTDHTEAKSKGVNVTSTTKSWLRRTERCIDMEENERGEASKSYRGSARASHQPNCASN